VAAIDALTRTIHAHADWAGLADDAQGADTAYAKLLAVCEALGDAAVTDPDAAPQLAFPLEVLTADRRRLQRISAEQRRLL
jgi:hypothetical protein